jgi:hypothetical protein
MKKNVYVIIILIVFISIFTRINSSKKTFLNKLVLKNIECLASSESPGVNCVGIGSLDCPVYNTKVILYVI